MIHLVLVKPETPGNIGAVARAMANFGFSKLVLVNPKCEHLSKEALDRAKHAKSILKNAKVIKELKGFDYYVATTSQLGTDYNIPRSPVSPEDLGTLLKGKQKKNIALVFGPEGAGLSNNEIQKCDFVVTIPSSKKYPALNLSHSVAIILYEIQKNAKGKVSEHIIPISSKEKTQLLKIIDKVLDNMKFATPSKKRTPKIVWKRLIGKGFLTKREAYALMGFFKKI